MARKSSNVIAYCSLNCAVCPSYTAEIADLARDLRKEIRRAKMHEIVEKIPLPGMEHFKECYETLGTMMTYRCKKVCREGGGSAKCPIKVCCKKKGLDGCWECEEFETCVNLKGFEPILGDKLRKTLRKIKRIGVDKYLASKPKT